MAKNLISVWWDIENCQVPYACGPGLIMHYVKHSIIEVASKVSLSFCAIGDMSRVCQPTQALLQQSGIILCDVPQTGEKNGADRMLLHCMSEWVRNHPPPAAIMIISGDKYFYQSLLYWKQIGYTIFGAAHNAREIAWMRQVATPWWEWNLLATGAYSTQQQLPRPYDPLPYQPIQVVLPTLVAARDWNVALLA